MTTENQTDGEPDETLWSCQFCDSVHESREEHQEHVERMHYAELLRESELLTENKEK